MAFQHFTGYPNWRKYSTLKTDKKCFLAKKQKECSVADPECLYRIPDPNFSILVPDPGSKRSWIRIRIKVFLTQTTAFQLSEKWSGIPDPGSGFLPHPGSRNQNSTGSGSAKPKQCLRWPGCGWALWAPALRPPRPARSRSPGSDTAGWIQISFLKAGDNI